ncbi:hypothetical protein [Mycolicibacterium helvum]|nr:hypothetical protein [Mycolicibacterium helvum]
MYLLLDYPRVLKNAGRGDDVYLFASDDDRHKRLYLMTGGDAASMLELTGAIDYLARQPCPDLARICVLARHRDAVSSRGTVIPELLLTAWVQQGQLHRAMAAAQARGDDGAYITVAAALSELSEANSALDVLKNVSDARLRATALSRVAAAMVRGDSRDSAAELSDYAIALTSNIIDKNRRAGALAELAAEFGSMGDRARCGRAAMEAVAIADPRYTDYSEDLAMAAAAIAELGDGQTAVYLGSRVTNDSRSKIYARVAFALAKIGDSELAGRVVAIVPDDHWRMRTLIEVTATTAIPTDGAAAQLNSALFRIDKKQQGRVSALVAAAQALADAGRFDWIELLASLISDSDPRRIDLLAGLAEALTRAGDLATARRIGEIIGATPGSVRPLPYELPSLMMSQTTPLAWHRQVADAIGELTGSGARALLIVAVETVKAGQPAIAVDLVRKITNHCGRAAAMNVVAHAMADTESRSSVAKVVDEASELAIRDPYGRVIAKCTAAVALAKSGDVVKYRQAIDAANADATSTTDASEKAKMLAVIVSALLEIGQCESAESLCEGVDLDDVRAALLTRVAVAHAQSGSVLMAERAANALTNDGLRRAALAAVATQLTRSGDLERAEQVIRGFSDTERTAERIAVCTALVRAGRVEQAIAMIRNVRSGPQRGEGWLAVIRELAANGMFRKARSCLTEIDDDILWEKTLSAVSIGYGRHGRVIRAVGTLLLMSDGDLRSEARSDLVAVLAEAGRPRAAKFAAELDVTYDDPDASIQRMSVVMAALAKGGKSKRARRTANRISDRPLRVAALASIAQECAAEGDFQQARRIMDEALSLAHSRIRDIEYSGALIAAVAALARIGDHQRAESLIRSAPRGKRPGAITAMAAGVAASDPDLANRLVRSVTSPTDVASAYLTVASALARSGHLDHAQACVNAIPDPAQRTAALPIIAEAAITAGHTDRSLDLLAAIPASRELAEVGALLAETGHEVIGRAAIARAWSGVPWFIPLPALAKVDPAAVVAATEPTE